MLHRTIVLACTALAALLATSSTAQAWGGYHYGYTHVGPYGAYHMGGTAGYGGYGGYHYGGAYRYGVGGYGGYHYGGYPYGGYGGYRAGYVRYW
ncbi:MAG TPA: hypothetical protein VMG10_35915 [Gemmataceae bacterium]|nr:hypothetical protein [Gemmataceae bacterium]